MSTSLRLMLLGIALLLFGLTFPTTLGQLVFLPLRFIYEPAINPIASELLQYGLAAIFPIAGLVLAFVGFFHRDGEKPAA